MLRDGLRAAIPAAVLSGIPSTAYALLARQDPLQAARAAGSLLLPGERRNVRLLVAAVPVHVAVSAGWAVVLAAILPRRRPLWEGTVAGLAIAALDLGVIGRRRPQIEELPTLPQVADHIAFGVIAAVAMGRREGSRT